MNLDELILQYLEYIEIEKGYSHLTIRDYRHYLQRFSVWVASINAGATPDDINQNLVQKYRAYLAHLTGENGMPLMKKITQYYHVIALRAFLRYLSTQRDIATLSPDKIDLPKSSSPTVTFLDGEQMERLLCATDTASVQGLRDRAILEILFSTGLRVSELTSLNRDQVDLKRKEFGVVGKGNKPRVVFVSDNAAIWVERYLAARQDQFKPLLIRHNATVDPLRNGEKMRLTARSVQRIVEKYTRRCGLSLHVSPHTLRHTFATDLLVHGADIRSVQEMLGHASIRTTQVYTHVTNRQLKEVHRSCHSGNLRDNRGDHSGQAPGS